MRSRSLWRKELLPQGAREETEEPFPIETVLMPPTNGDLRVLLRQRDEDGGPARTASPRPMGQVFVIDAMQDGKPLPVEIRYDRVIWSGLSWAVGEIRHEAFTPGKPIRLRLAVTEHDPELHLEGQVYRVEY